MCPKNLSTMSLVCHSSCSYLFMFSCLGPGQRVSWSSEDFGFHEVLGFLRYPVSLLFSPRRVLITLQDNEWKINFQEINEALQVHTLTTRNTLSLCTWRIYDVWSKDRAWMEQEWWNDGGRMEQEWRNDGGRMEEGRRRDGGRMEKLTVE